MSWRGGRSDGSGCPSLAYTERVKMFEQSDLELYADGSHPASIGTITRYLEPDFSLMRKETDGKWCAISNQRRPFAVVEIERDKDYKNWEELVQQSCVDIYWVIPQKTLESGERTYIRESRLYGRLREAKRTNAGQEAFEGYLLLLEVAEYEIVDAEKGKSTYLSKRQRNQRRNRKKLSERQPAPSVE